jgi:hypothetical protein
MVLTGCRPGASPSTLSKNHNGREMAELQMTGMRIQSYGDTGIQWEMSAPFGEVFSQKNLMRVKNMNVQLFEDGQKSSDVSGQIGFLSTGPRPQKDVKVDPSLMGMTLEEGDMFLSGDVVIISTDGSKLNTDWIHYHRQTDLITSLAPVKVYRHDSITYGIGMEAKSDMAHLKIFNETLVIPEQPEQTQQ